MAASWSQFTAAIWANARTALGYHDTTLLLSRLETLQDNCSTALKEIKGVAWNDSAQSQDSRNQLERVYWEITGAIQVLKTTYIGASGGVSANSYMEDLNRRLDAARTATQAGPSFLPSQPQPKRVAHVPAGAHVLDDMLPSDSSGRVVTANPRRATMTDDFETRLGTYRPDDSVHTVLVAVKSSHVYNDLYTKGEQAELDHEITRWIELDHPNVLPFLATAHIPANGLPRVWFIVPWMKNGDVMKYIKTHRDVDKHALLRGIARGLLYLHTRNPPIVHGSVRGSNVLIDELGKPRLCDFGLENFRDITGDLYLGKPTRYSWWPPEWQGRSHRKSPETQAVVSTASDVFSFGMTAWEIYAEKRPFSPIRSYDIIQMILRGERPDIPSNWTESPAMAQLVELIPRCWDQEPSRRPTMSEVVQILGP